ncbi:sigma-70 family RNA polymerase sigma factor [bacterium]|nr:sigma-70 family RNA polymerase sigma factor [candidate division CSSED10-310 bacterium]
MEYRLDVINSVDIEKKAYTRSMSIVSRFPRITNPHEVVQEAIQKAKIKFITYNKPFSSDDHVVNSFLMFVAYETRNEIRAELNRKWVNPVESLPQESVLEKISRLEEYERVYNAIEKLGTPCRNLIGTFMFHDGTKKEMARALHIPRSTFYQRLRDCLARLKKKT